MTPLPEPLIGPRFSSYAADDVVWLLSDLSDARLETPPEQREQHIRAGGHYAESLPVEYVPSPEYLRLFRTILRESAGRVACLVGAVTEKLLAEQGAETVLVSLARAGTPVGILLRRWAKLQYGLNLPHYSMSIVRDHGLDPVALRYLATHHDPERVVFVDGWTGKGVIARELHRATNGTRSAGMSFVDYLAVLADPGRCTRIYGTRQDALIPSACLNSTVCGLVSRTVLNRNLVGPHEFHGAKFYPELAALDQSHIFLDAIVSRFDCAADLLRRNGSPTQRRQNPDFYGLRVAECISEDYDLHDINLVKPGIGETTRALLRRIPWKILVREGDAESLAHIRLLAAQREVPITEIADLPFSCVGLVHPAGIRDRAVPDIADGTTR
jgi:hypothetical protein